MIKYLSHIGFTVVLMVAVLTVFAQDLHAEINPYLSFSGPRPVALWSFDGTLQDTMRSIPASPTGLAVFDTSNKKYGGSSLALNGVSDALNVPGLPDSNLDLMRTITICAWVNLQSTPPVGRTALVYSGDPLLYNRYAFGVTSTGEVIASFWPYSPIIPPIEVKGGSLPLNKWVFLCLTVAGHQVTIYVDGAAKAVAWLPPGYYPPVPPPPAPLWMGMGLAPEYDYGNSFLHANLDEVAFFPFPLDPLTIQSLYRAFMAGGSSPPSPPQVDALPEFTNAESLVLSGRKDAQTDLYINGVLVDGYYNSTVWTASRTLGEGYNRFDIKTVNSSSISSTVTVSTIRDTAQPTAFSRIPQPESFENNSNITPTIELHDGISGINFTDTLATAMVKGSAGVNVAGNWAVADSMLVYTPTTPLADDRYTIDLVAKDNAGNNLPFHLEFTIDTIPPLSPSIAPISPQRVTWIQIQGSKTSDAAGMTVTAGSGRVEKVIITGETTWLADISGLSEGETTVSATAVDRAGNSSESVTISVLVDLTPPTAPSITPIVSPTIATSVTLSGLKEADATLYLNGSELAGSFAETTWSKAVTLSEGNNTFTVYAKDIVGNQGPTASVAIVRDTGPPTILATTPSNGVLTADAGTIVVTLSDTFSSIDLPKSLDGATVKTSGGAIVAGSWSVVGGTLVFTPSTTLADGAYVVTLNPADSLGNAGTATFSFTLDATPPVVQSLVMSPSSPHKAETVTFTLTFSETTSGIVTPIIKLLPETAQGSTAINLTGSWLNTTTWSGSFTFTTASGDGAYTITAAGAKDLAGNVMPEQVVGSFVLDTIVPPAPIVAAVVTPTVATSLTLTGSKEADASLYWNGSEVAGVFAGTTWSKTVALNEGDNTFTAYAKDAAGNQGPTASVAIVRDTSPPTISTTTPSAGALTTSAGTIIVTLSDSFSTVDLSASLYDTTVKTNTGTAIVGNWSVVGGTLVFTPNNALSDGSYVVTLHPADSLGNVGHATFSFTLDSIPPTVQSLVMSPTSPHKAETVTFTVTFSEIMNSNVQPSVVLRKEGLIFDTTYTLTGSWLNGTTWRGQHTFTGSSGDGEYAVEVASAKDLAGNRVAPQTTGIFLLDTTAPASPTLALTSSPTKVATQILTGTRPADTAIVINGVQKVAASADTSWSVSYALAEGANILTVVARDAAGNDSPAAGTTIVLDTTPPLFTVDVYQAQSAQATQIISGRKDPGCSVRLNGTEIIGSADLNETWSHSITLEEGIATRLTFLVTDVLGNVTTRTLDLLYDAAAPPALAAGVLQAAGNGRGTEVSLIWPAYVESADLAYYRIYAVTADFGAIAGLTPLGTSNRGSKTFKVTGLTEGVTYYFAVEPVDASGNSEPQVHTASAVPADTAAPEEISALTATAGYSAGTGNSVTLHWNGSLNSKGDLAEQFLYVDSGTGYGSGSALGKTSVSHTVTGLADATLYKFRITTRDNSGHESGGTVVQAVTRLANPTGLAATAGKNQVALRWNAVTSSYLKEYRVYRVVSTSLADVAGLTPVKILTGTSWNDTGLTNGTTYRYAVTTVNTSGAERTGVESLATTPRQDADGPVIGTISLGAGQVVTAPLTVEASASDLESAMAKVELYLDGDLVATGTGSSVNWYWNVIGSQDGNHIVKVVASDALGNFTELSRSVVVSLAPPTTPQITTHLIVSSSPVYTVKVSGSTPLSSTVSLRVNGTVIGSVAASASGAFSFSGLSLVEGENRLAVKATHRGGDSPWSADYKITVDTGAPLAPTDLGALALAGGAVQFVWQAGAGETPTGYNLYQSGAAYTSTGTAGVSKVNTSPITYLFKETIPAGDSLRYYAVTALDGAGNESSLSNLVAIASDRSLPTVATVTFAAGGAPAAALTTGPAMVQVALSVSEPLKELPFFSLEPQIGSPIVLTLAKIDDLHYSGSFRVDATSPHGTTTWKFSGKDLIGNRGSQQGSGPTLDVRGPVATVTAPATLQQLVAAVPVTVVFDEAAIGTPVLTFKDSAGAVVPVTDLVQAGDAQHWQGAVDLAGLTEGEGRFLLVEARDVFGNLGTTVTAGQTLLLYRDAPPSPAIPQDLTAVAKAGGRIDLLWKAVSGATSYKLYRRAENESDFALLATQGATGYTDPTAQDDRYAYAVSAVGLLQSESPRSPEVWATADREAPVAPTDLALVLQGSGIKATWDVPTGEAPVSYRLYRAGTAITTTTGLNAVAAVALPEAIDGAPNTAMRHYVVTALDALGNESAPSASVSIDFPVAPVKNLVLTQLEGGKPTLTWEAPQGGLQGYYIYRNGQKINADPTPGTSFTDGYYAGSSVTYGISALDGYGNESPVRTLTLPELTLNLPEGTSLRRGLLEMMPVNLTSSAAVTVKELRLKVGASAESTLAGPFALAAGIPFTVQKVAATPQNAADSVAVVGTAVIEPAPGTSLRLTRTVQVPVRPSGSALEVFSEPLIRGTNAHIRLKVNNLGSARMDFVTSENGGATAQVRVMLKDQDGNILAAGRLDQRTGSQVVNSGSYATARIEPGASFLSEPLSFAVPASAPYAVVLEAVIANTYYHYGWADQVGAPGLQQSTAAVIADVSYNAVAQVEKELYKQGELVVISGKALSTADGSGMPYVPVRIGLSASGFDRFYTVSTDGSGNFRYTYQPASNEAGHYNVWAMHPDLSNRSVQDSFDILAMTMAPGYYSLKLAKGQSYDIPVFVKNYSATVLTGTTFSTTVSDGLSATVLNGFSQVDGNQSRSLTLRISAAANAPASGYATLTVATDQGLNSRLDVNVSLFSTIPIITTSPAYIDTGLVRGTQRLESITLKNSGAATLYNARITPPSTPWMSLTVPSELGSLSVGQSTAIGVLLRPGTTVPSGVYNDRIIITSDNHIPYTVNIQVTVTSDAVGSVVFDVLNELLNDVSGATINLQHQSLPELFYTLKTGSDGTASKFDIPEGRYSFNVSATGHKPYSGSFVVTPGLTVTVPIALEVTLVEIEWSVTPVLINDRYEIKITQTFETNVPTSVLVVDPPGINLPAMAPGEVLNGEFTISNQGLIKADFIGLNYPHSFDDYDIEVQGNIPLSLGPYEKIIVPYRVVRRALP